MVRVTSSKTHAIIPWSLNHKCTHEPREKPTYNVYLCFNKIANLPGHTATWLKLVYLWTQCKKSAKSPLKVPTQCFDSKLSEWWCHWQSHECIKLSESFDVKCSNYVLPLVLIPSSRIFIWIDTEVCLWGQDVLVTPPCPIWCHCCNREAVVTVGHIVSVLTIGQALC